MKGILSVLLLLFLVLPYSAFAQDAGCANAAKEPMQEQAQNDDPQKHVKEQATDLLDSDDMPKRVILKGSFCDFWKDEHCAFWRTGERIEAELTIWESPNRVNEKFIGGPVPSEACFLQIQKVSGYEGHLITGSHMSAHELPREGDCLYVIKAHHDFDPYHKPLSKHMQDILEALSKDNMLWIYRLTDDSGRGIGSTGRDEVFVVTDIHLSKKHKKVNDDSD